MTRLLIDHGEIARFVPAIFCHASEGQRVQIRAYYEGSEKTFSTDSAVINGAGLNRVQFESSNSCGLGWAVRVPIWSLFIGGDQIS